VSKGNDRFSPLWLSLACNELRIFGEFTTVTKHIEDMPEDFDGLVSNIIKRIDSEASNSSIREVFDQILVSILEDFFILNQKIFYVKLLSLIAVTQSGLPESEAYLLLFAKNENLDKLQWAQILISLKPFLIYSNYGNLQLVNFFHDRLRKARLKINIYMYSS